MGAQTPKRILRMAPLTLLALELPEFPEFRLQIGHTPGNLQGTGNPKPRDRLRPTTQGANGRARVLPTHYSFSTILRTADPVGAVLKSGH